MTTLTYLPAEAAPSRQPKPGSAAERILAILQQRYPCAALPTGAMTEISTEVGVTRERVRQIANQYGYTGRLRKGSGARQCRHCGGVPKVHSPLCEDCSWITISCANCDGLFRRRRSVVFLKQKGKATERFTCSVACRDALKPGKALGPRPQCRVPADKIARAIELRGEGLTYREIGERFGVTWSAAYHWCNRAAGNRS